MEPKSFRKFLEDKESEASSPYIDALKDELGIDPRDLSADPQVASFYSLGGNTKNIGVYRVVKLIRDDQGNPTHAVVKTIEDKSIKDRRYREKDGGMSRLDGDSEEQTLIVPIGELDKLMSQDFQPPPAQAGMA
jgi:hypothetical protein